MSERRMERTLAVKIIFGWTLTARNRRHKMEPVATKNHVAADDDDGFCAHIKTRSGMESYATRMNISRRSKEEKRALEQLKKTAKLFDDRSELWISWAMRLSRISIFWHSCIFVHWSEGCRRTSLSSNDTRIPPRLISRRCMFTNWTKRS